jgi:hypothetical protein
VRTSTQNWYSTLNVNDWWEGEGGTVAAAHMVGAGYYLKLSSGMTAERVDSEASTSGEQHQDEQICLDRPHCAYLEGPSALQVGLRS